MKAVWGKNLNNNINLTLGFYLELNDTQNFNLKIAAKACYKIYVDSKMVFFGPMRSAHGYSRIHELNLYGKKIAVFVYSVNVTNYCWVMENPFFSIEINADNKIYTSDDFKCYRINDRIEKALRYSVQRGFEEAYQEKGDRELFLKGIINFKEVEVIEVPNQIILNNIVNYPKLNLHTDIKEIDSGYVEIGERNKYIPVYDRAQLQPEIYGGIKIEEADANLYNDVAHFVYKNNSENYKYKYKTYAFNRSLTGFLNIKLESKNVGSLYIVYDEMLFPEVSEKYVLFSRNCTTNAMKWNILKEGNYNLSSFEPYTFKYISVIYEGDMDFALSLTDYENPDTNNLELTTDDEDLNLIIEAARNTISQNAVDILTDCPSRERSGWLSDSYFSSVGEKAFTGDNLVEKAFLENYSMSKRDYMPDGMIYMNYPSDSFDKVYIPNWSLWYILELTKYQRNYPESDIINKSKDTVYGLLNFFSKYENEYNLLENLESWVFVEWSKANDKDHIIGVNIPSNMCYQKVLDEAGRVYNNLEWINKAKVIRNNIKKLAYNGVMFVDNLIRNEKNELIQTNNLTEVCQYYGFFFNAINKDEYKDLYDLLMNKLGPNRKDGFMIDVCKPNMMYGIYMRLDLLLRDGKRNDLLKEIKTYFLPMAKLTGTLWEHNSTFASLNHAFTSYSIRWIIYALFSYDIIENKFIESSEKVNIKAKLVLPLDIDKLKVLKLNN